MYLLLSSYMKNDFIIAKFRLGIAEIYIIVLPISNIILILFLDGPFFKKADRRHYSEAYSCKIMNFLWKCKNMRKVHSNFDNQIQLFRSANNYNYIDW